MILYYYFWFYFFFFKQKTAYEMRISDWSSDVCSSDLRVAVDVDPLDIDAGRVGDAEIDPHRQRVLVALEVRLDVREGVAEQARRLAQRVDRILDLLDRKSTRLNSSH